jgi:AcrR family transcriptional regulator
MARAAAQPSLRERRRARTREALLSAAASSFTAAGFHDTTVDEIAALAEVSVSSLYNYFPGGKGELYRGVVEHAIEANRTYMDAAYDDSRSAFEQVLAAADASLRFHLDHPGYFTLVSQPSRGALGGDEGGAAAEAIASRVEIEVGRLAAVIARGVRRRELVKLDPALTATFLWGAWNGVIALTARADRLRRDDAEIREVLALGRRQVIDGLRREASR